MFDDFSPEFLAGLERLGIDWRDERLLGAFADYRRELLDWNERINLTAITDPHEMLLKHFLDSLALLQAYDRPEARLLDIGSGAGFPGLPLKIVRPQWQVTLLEATGKKVRFLQHLVELLQLDDVELLHGRAEELAREQEYHTSFDVVTARAVAALPKLLPYCAPFCRANGLIILPKKGDLTEEIKRAQPVATRLGLHLKDEVTIDLPGLVEDGRRLLVWSHA